MEGASVIGAKELSSGFSSVWGGLTPNSQRVIRRINLTVDRYFLPMDSNLQPDRHAIVNEVGFELAKRRFSSDKPPAEFSAKVSKEAFETAKDRLMGLPGLENVEISPLSKIEESEALDICYRTVFFIQNVAKSTPTFFPEFPGCGYLDPSVGDILTGDTLYEVKSGARPFRSPDIRQLLIYSAANYAANGKPIGKIGLLNPRYGTFFVSDIQAICFELGGLSAQNLFEQLIFLVSSGGVSR